MAHRCGAVLVLCAVLACFLKLKAALTVGHPLRRLASGWLALICAQAALGIWTVLSNKAADIATLHVVVGAGALVTGALMTLLAGMVFGERPSAPSGAVGPAATAA
jgi:cytochrome c oxidase assembly protein subunit 15